MQKQLLDFLDLQEAVYPCKWQPSDAVHARLDAQFLVARVSIECTKASPELLLELPFPPGEGRVCECGIINVRLSRVSQGPREAHPDRLRNLRVAKAHQDLAQIRGGEETRAPRVAFTTPDVEVMQVAKAQLSCQAVCRESLDQGCPIEAPQVQGKGGQHGAGWRGVRKALDPGVLQCLSHRQPSARICPQAALHEVLRLLRDL
mmetsp:Transcript_130076/g.277854  ORF Transcript_130076/g.277854 Transcript_130076/m.277854 type:complete len:204 (-) Transcript_130076:1106-1717(-)